ncbi:hypothetical protein BDU57DRAFT_568712 [Ampelomyces quisqualis]|uniref:Uncharacterized protein n=1 Tax=Ampelomyces quisqualis TaxID=50730 RepID=A0A6A5QZJ8_AMPQU|nr:hypothetical protein BDU57DRAFT_568712 [Ampelomyces quisqualis]
MPKLELFEKGSRCPVGGHLESFQVRRLMVCNLLYAWKVALNEVHAASSAKTITYRQIIRPMMQRTAANSWPRPAVVGITGTPLADGIVTTENFFKFAVYRPDAATSPDVGVRVLAELQRQNLARAWKKLQSTLTDNAVAARKVRGPKLTALLDKHARDLRGNEELRVLFDVFAKLVTHFFVARDYTSVDAWGKPLNLIDSTLEVKYKVVPHKDEPHAELVKWEQRPHATQTRKFKEDKRAWKDGGCVGHEPTKPALSSADPKAYHTARIMATLPNLPRALRAWQARNPKMPPAIGAGCEWGDSLSKDNQWLQRPN